MLTTYRRALFGVVFAAPLLAGGSAIANNSHSDNHGPAPSASGHHTVGSLGTTHTFSGSTGHHTGGGGSGNSHSPRCLPARHGHPATCPPPNGGGTTGGGTTGGGTAGGGTTGGNGNGSQGGGQANNGGNDQGGNGGQGDHGGNGGNQGGGQANSGGNDQGDQGGNGGNQGDGQANNGGNNQGGNDQGDNGQGGIGGNGQGGTGNGDQGGGYAGGGSDDCTLDNLTTCKSDNSNGGGDPGCTTADLCGPPANIPNIATAVPEPASVLLFGAGIAAVMSRRRKSKRSLDIS